MIVASVKHFSAWCFAHRRELRRVNYRYETPRTIVNFSFRSVVRFFAQIREQVYCGGGEKKDLTTQSAKGTRERGRKKRKEPDAPPDKLGGRS